MQKTVMMVLPFAIELSRPVFTTLLINKTLIYVISLITVTASWYNNYLRNIIFSCRQHLVSERFLYSYCSIRNNFLEISKHHVIIPAFLKFISVRLFVYIGWETWRERDKLKDLDVDERIILKWIFKKWDGSCTGFIWLILGQVGRLENTVINLRVP